MSTKKKTETSHLSPKKQFQYEFAEAKPTLVEEPFMPLPEIKLDMTQRYTFEEYLTWIDDVGRELINGFIHVLSAPLRIHARISFELSYLFRMLTIKRKGKCQIYHAPFNVRLSLNNDTDADKIVNVVQPDICVVCDPAKLDKYGCMGSPDLVVEVLSPSTLKKDWNYKFNLYEAAGVREYWIVDPKAKTVAIFLLQPDGKYDLGSVYECDEKAPVHIFEGLEIDLNELFEV